jgi:hypothetical protein
VLLLSPKTRRWSPLVALGMHAALELAVGPDLLGWEMAALLLCLWPFSAARARQGVVPPSGHADASVVSQAGSDSPTTGP